MNIYVTYDINQKRFFEKNGEKNLIYGLHPKSYKRFWIFERNNKINKLLKEWGI